MKTRTTRTKRPVKKTGRGAPARTALPDHLAHLSEIRSRFHAVPPAVASSLLAAHDEASCRDQGLSTKARDTFEGAMNWARTFGDHAHDPGVAPLLTRWFLDCLTSLGNLLAGHAVATNPSHHSAIEDSVRDADKLLTRVTRRARSAVGSNAPWSDALESALSAPDGPDARTMKLTSLAALFTHWLDARTASREPAPPLTAFGINGATVVSLNHAATMLNVAMANKPAARQVDHDSPEVNTAEGRLYFAMRAIWHDLAEAREDGRTALQLTTTPSILRGLNLHARARSAAPASAPSAGAASAAPPG